MAKSATAQASSIVTGFDGISRVADATGIGLDRVTAERGGQESIRELGFETLGAARA